MNKVIPLGEISIWYLVRLLFMRINFALGAGGVSERRDPMSTVLDQWLLTYPYEGGQFLEVSTEELSRELVRRLPLSTYGTNTLLSVSMDQFDMVQITALVVWIIADRLENTEGFNLAKQTVAPLSFFFQKSIHANSRFYWRFYDRNISRYALHPRENPKRQQSDAQINRVVEHLKQRTRLTIHVTRGCMKFVPPVEHELFVD